MSRFHNTVVHVKNEKEWKEVMDNLNQLYNVWKKYGEDTVIILEDDIGGYGDLYWAEKHLLHVISFERWKQIIEGWKV